MKRTREQLRARAARKKKQFRQKRAYDISRGPRVQTGTGGQSRALTVPPRSLIPNFGGPFGQTFETELNYAEYFSLNPSLGAGASYIFHANDLYDPNNSGTGHQPHGYDQLVQIYENWQVLSSAIEVVLFPANTATALINGSGPVIPSLIGSVLSIGVRDTAQGLTSILTTLTDVLERPNIITKFVNSNSEPVSIRASFSMPKFYGRTRGLDDNDITGTANGQPTDKVFYHVMLHAPNGTDDPPSHTLNARIKYKVRFFNPKNLVQS